MGLAVRLGKNMLLNLGLVGIVVAPSQGRLVLQTHSRLWVVNHHLIYLLQFPDLPSAAFVEHVVHRALG